jgi:hypothetical protein
LNNLDPSASPASPSCWTAVQSPLRPLLFTLLCALPRGLDPSTASAHHGELKYVFTIKFGTTERPWRVLDPSASARLSELLDRCSTPTSTIFFYTFLDPPEKVRPIVSISTSRGAQICTQNQIWRNIINHRQCCRSAGILAADAAAQAAGPPEACAAGDFFEASSR